ncbi:FAD-binding protein [Aestuariibius sp. 2305UL40-4]|uniref:FAD-binding oxidoreductase n=1 Tax=Aestuariibius violaceus TaxID=3234132 RepID=UPI00345F09D2
MRWKSDTYTGWGRALSAAGEKARPERQNHLAAIAASEPAPAIGNCRSYGDACLNDGGKAIDTTKLDRILSFDAETGMVEVEAGLTLGDLAKIYAPQGWLPAVMPGTGFATVGGAIAMDVHGKNHHNLGSFGQHVEDITLLQGDTERTITAKNKALFQATIGGLGQTGIISKATLRLQRCKGDVMMVTERRAEGWDQFLDLLDRSEATYTVGWIDATAQGDKLGRGILEEAETGAGLVPAPKKSKAIPTDAPGFALSKPIVRTFNEAYYRRVPASGRTVVKPIQDFFFPLDRIHDWNRLYGKRGFHQFQCVVPIAEAPALRAMLDLIAQSGLASPLAVLKRMGPGRAGYLSFPMEGYTLAVDFPNSTEARKLITRLEEMTTEASGRIYFAKDALATPERVQAMYPDLSRWQKEVAKADPGGALATDLIRRLKLRDPA